MKTLANSPLMLMLAALLCLIQSERYSLGQDVQSSSDNELIIDEVLEGWSVPGQEITSLTMKTEIEEVTNNERKKVSMEYAFSEGKIEFVRSEDTVKENDGDAKNALCLRTAYDGHVNASFYNHPKRPMGTIEYSGKSSKEFFVNYDVLATAFWLNPKRVLLETGWQLSSMTFEDKFVDVDGLKCRRLHIRRINPSTGRLSKKWNSIIDVAPERAYAPVQWQMLLNNKLRTKLKMNYEDKDSSFVLVNWSINNYVGADAGNSRKGKVVEFSLNPDIDDSRFAIEFPIGTHISEKSVEGFRYFVQVEGGMAAITEGEYGSLK